MIIKKQKRLKALYNKIRKVKKNNEYKRFVSIVGITNDELDLILYALKKARKWRE